MSARACADCGAVRKIEGRGLCLRCHSRHRRAGTLDLYARLPPVAVVWSRFFPCCQQCGTDQTPHAAHGLCDACYHAAYMAPIVARHGSYRRYLREREGPWDRRVRASA